MTDAPPSMRELSERLRNSLTETGQCEMVVADTGTAELLRKAAYKWAEVRNYTVKTSNERIHKEPLKRRLTIQVVQATD